MRFNSLSAAFLSLAIATGAAADDTSEKIQQDLAKAKTVREEAKKLADEKLLASIEGEIEAVRKSSLKAELRIKAIGIMEKEKELFEKSGWMPVSERLQKVSSTYVKNLNAADKALEAAYEKYISLLLAAKDTDGAKKVLEEKKKDLPKRALISVEWDNQTVWEFFLDESTGTAKDRWRFVKGELIIYTPPTTPQGKPAIESTIKISEDGLTFTLPRTNDRTYTGKRVDSPKK